MDNASATRRHRTARLVVVVVVVQGVEFMVGRALLGVGWLLRQGVLSDLPDATQVPGTDR